MPKIVCLNEGRCGWPDCSCVPKVEDKPKPDRMHSESKLQPPVEHCTYCKGFGFVVRKDLAS